MFEMARLFLSNGHIVTAILNHSFIEGESELKSDIQKSLPGIQLYTFRIVSPCAAHDKSNLWRQYAARLLREHAIASLLPDFVHVPALLADGWGDDAVGSIDEISVYIPSSITQHDLIPLALPDIYMSDVHFRNYYMKKLEGVKKADLVLAISEYSRKEALDFLGLNKNDVINISSAADNSFFKCHPSVENIASVLNRYSLKTGFLFYVPGGFDPRKNLERLLKAYAMLPKILRVAHPLVVGSKLDSDQREVLKAFSISVGLADEEFFLTGYLADTDLICFYHACYGYIFPSLHEGFGLPVLEAMACGAPVIASNCTSIPEVVGLDEALFDPYSEYSMASKIQQLLEDRIFRERLIKHASKQSRRFSWEKSAEVAVSAILRRHKELLQAGWQPTPINKLPTCDDLLEKLSQTVAAVVPSKEDVIAFQTCFNANLKAAI